MRLIANLKIPWTQKHKDFMGIYVKLGPEITYRLKVGRDFISKFRFQLRKTCENKINAIRFFLLNLSYCIHKIETIQ